MDGVAVVREGELLAGKYRVERLLGAGGMGVVVAAVHEVLEERVAIKLLRPEIATSEEAAGRFLREARATVRIKSQHVVRVLDAGRLDDGTLYLAMELLEGADLDKLVRGQGPLPPALAVEAVLQAAKAVALAHELGIVHRDLKPSNLFLARVPELGTLVKVLDFGIAKLPQAAAQVHGPLTHTHVVMGSPRYMAPEQIRKPKDVDGRVDVWALGITLYELVTGTIPFEDEESPQALLAAILQDAPERLSDPRLDEAVGRCLAKDPAERWQSMGELVRALEPLAGDRAAARSSLSARLSPHGGPAQTLPTDLMITRVVPRAGVPQPGSPEPASGDRPPLASPASPAPDSGPAGGAAPAAPPQEDAAATAQTTLSVGRTAVLSAGREGPFAAQARRAAAIAVPALALAIAGLVAAHQIGLLGADPPAAASSPQGATAPAAAAAPAVHTAEPVAPAVETAAAALVTAAPTSAPAPPSRTAVAPAGPASSRKPAPAPVPAPAIASAGGSPAPPASASTRGPPPAPSPTGPPPPPPAPSKKKDIGDKFD